MTIHETKNKWAPPPGQLEKVRDRLLERHQGEDIHYSTCPNNGCFDMCVLRQHVKDGKVVAIETDDSIHVGMGREDEYCDPDDIQKGMYQRRACVRGRGMRSDAYSPTRLLYPMKRVGPKPSHEFVRISWEEALDTIAAKILETREKYGPLSVWSDGMQGISWDPFGSHLPGGGISTWGEDSFEPTNAADDFTYGDPEYHCAGVNSGNSENQTFFDSKLIILWGFDAAINYPETVYYLEMAKERGIPIITIDPRYTWTAEAIGTQHIFIRPGTDLAMMMAMCQVIFEEDLWDHEFCDKWVEPKGLAKWRAYVMGEEYNEAAKTPEWAAPICGVPAETIRELARLYGKTSQTGSVYIRMVWAAARQIYGKQTARGLNYLQALCGNVGKKGCSGNGVGFGASENYLTYPYLGAYVGDKPGQYGNTCCMEAEMWAKAILLHDKLDKGEITEEYYKGEIGCPLNTPAPNIHMLFTVNSARNHVSGWYGASDRIKALKMVDFVAYAHWNLKSPNIPYADIVLPKAHSYIEHYTHINSSPYFGGWFKAINAGCQNALMWGDGGGDPPGECKNMGWIIREIAKRLGIGDEVMSAFDGYDHDEYPEVLEKLAEQSWNDWRSNASGWGGAQHNPPTWEEFRKNPIFMVPMQDYHVYARKNIEKDIPFPTPSGKIEFYCDWIAESDLRTAVRPNPSLKCFGSGWLPPMARYKHSPEGPHSPRTRKFPLYMVTPHSFYKHHTAYDHSLIFRDEYRNSVWMSVPDAKARGIKDGDKVMVHNEAGQSIVTAYVTSRMTPGVCAVLFGRWYEPSGVKTDIMPDGIDTRGDCNLLIPDEFYDDVKGACLDGALVEIDLFDPNLHIDKLLEVR